MNETIPDYIKHEFENGQVLTAEEMNDIDDGIYINREALKHDEEDIENIKHKLTKFEDLNQDGNITITYEDVS